MKSLMILIGGLLMATQASAQPEVRTPASNEEAVNAARRFSQCVVRREPDKAREVLAMDYRTDAYQTALRELALEERNCIRGATLRFGGVVLAGGLAEAMLPRLLGDRALGAALLAEDARPTPRDTLEEAAFCTVAAQPDRVAALLATEPATAEERAATTSLAPALAECLPEGAQTRVNALGLRALLALASYNLVGQGGVRPAGGQ